MKRVLVLGAGGLLGLNLAFEASQDYEVFGTLYSKPFSGVPFKTREGDLLQKGALDEAFDWAQADYVINCVALADLEACEQEPELARRLNTELPERTALAVAKKGGRLIHISTDAIFDGKQGNYNEEDEANPQNEYARSKHAGEIAVRSTNHEAIIARVNFFGWSLSGTRSLAEFFYNNLNSGKIMKGLTDRYFNPLLANHLSRILLKMLEADLSGIYHVASPKLLSKYDFGVAIAKQFGFDINLIEKARADELNYQAARSPNLSLQVDKLERDLGQELPDVYAGIKAMHDLFFSGYVKRLRSLGTTEKIPEARI